MARISQGNNLSDVIQQPGAKFQEDGYGLSTGSINFKADITASVGSTINRGSACPIGAYSYCKAHKYSVTFDALGVANYTVEYVGITPAVGGVTTDPQITGSQGLTTDHITTHPNFYELATGFTGSPIAGVGSGSGGTLALPVYTAATNSDGTAVYRGNNGATFKNQSGGPFAGFQVAQYKGYYGKTNYLAPTSSFSGHFYTTAAANVTGMRDRVGKTSGTNTFNSIKVVPDYLGTTFVNGTKHQLLLAQVSFEDYGSLYKVSFEVRFNREGYEPAVYAAS